MKFNFSHKDGQISFRRIKVNGAGYICSPHFSDFDFFKMLKTMWLHFTTVDYFVLVNQTKIPVNILKSVLAY